jgi:ribbon-helix-helix CopG family protein
MEPMRKIHTSLMLDPTLVHRLDRAAAVRDRSRSWLAGQAIEQFLELESDGTRPPSELAPLGGVSSARPGTPPAAAGRGLGRSPLEASPGSTFPSEESLQMPDTPLGKLMDECCAPIRRMQEEHAIAATSNQARRNGEAGSPAPKPRGAGHDEH